MIEIRPARPAEYHAVGELTIAAYRTLPVDHLWGGYDDEIRKVAERAESCTVLVAADGEELLGSVTYADDPSSGWLEWTEPGEAQFRLLAVSDGARGRGVGETLVRACIDLAVRHGHAICIHTTEWMTAAQRLYPRLGFTRTPERDVDYDGWGGPTYDDLPPVWVGKSFLAYTRSSPPT